MSNAEFPCRTRPFHATGAPFSKGNNGPVPAISTALPRRLAASQRRRPSRNASHRIHVETWCVDAVSVPPVPRTTSSRHVCNSVARDAARHLVVDRDTGHGGAGPNKRSFSSLAAQSMFWEMCDLRSRRDACAARGGRAPSPRRRGRPKQTGPGGAAARPGHGRRTPSRATSANDVPRRPSLRRARGERVRQKETR